MHSSSISVYLRNEVAVCTGFCLSFMGTLAICLSSGFMHTFAANDSRCLHLR